MLNVTQQGRVELRFEPQDAFRTSARNHPGTTIPPGTTFPPGAPPRWYSPSQQPDFDAPQESVASLDDQPRVACAVHGQPDLGRNVHLHCDVQEANETGGDREARETERQPRLRAARPPQPCPAPLALAALPLATMRPSCSLLVSRDPKPEDFPGPSRYLWTDLCPSSVCESA